MPPSPRAGGGVLLGSLTLNLLSVALPIVILQTYDRVLPNQALGTLALMMLGLDAVVLMDAVLRLGRGYVTSWDAARYEHITGCRAVDRLLAGDVQEFEQSPPGVHLDRLFSIETLRDFYAGQAKLLMVDLPFVLVFLGLIVVIAGPLVIVPVVMLVLLAATSFVIGRVLAAVLQERAELDDRRYSFIIEVLGAIHTIKTLAFEPAMQRRYERLQGSGAGLTYRIAFLNNLSQAVGFVFTYATMIAVVTYGATMIMAENLTIGALAASTLLSGRTVQPLLRALNFWTQFQHVRVALRRANELFAAKPESAAQAPSCPDLEGKIDLWNVSFRYPGAEAPILDGLILSARAGDVIGIKGGMGSGKTTLMWIVMNMLHPDDGHVLFDGEDLSGCDPQELRSQIAYMPQNAVLFDGTILENLTMFNVAGLEGRAIEVCRKLGLDQAINRLPGGYETRLGGNGESEISNGLRQSVAMARALVTPGKILLFDEANAALDSRTDARLKDALAEMKGEMTMILVSHRPSLLALADRIYVLENGRLVEQEAPPVVAPRSTNAPSAASRYEERPLAVGGGRR